MRRKKERKGNERKKWRKKVESDDGRRKEVGRRERGRKAM